MRSIRLFLLGATTTTLLGGIVAAQPPATTTVPGPRSRDTHAGHGRQDGPGGRRGGMRALLMRNITLSQAQQTQINAINGRYRAQHQQLRDEARAKWQGRGPATGTANGAARPDSATRAAFHAEREASRGRARERQQRQIAEVRAVLTPAQQTSFDRNVAELRTRGAERAGRGGHRGAARPGAR